MTIRVELPYHLRVLAEAGGEVRVEVREATLRGVLEALEVMYPMLRGTIRDQRTGERRPFLRFFADEQDLSLQGMECVLPPAVLEGRETLLVVAAVAGG